MQSPNRRLPLIKVTKRWLLNKSRDTVVVQAKQQWTEKLVTIKNLKADSWVVEKFMSIFREIKYF